MSKIETPRPSEENSNKPDQVTPPGTPRWVKVFGLIGLVLVLLFVILHLTGNSPGPGSHTGHSSVTE